MIEITKESVLEVLKTHKISNHEILVKDLGLNRNISVNLYDPYPEQLDILCRLLDQVLNQGKRILVLNYPTGAGKSYLSMALAVLLDYYQRSRITVANKHITVTFRNNLFQQYENSFNHLYSVKGKGNYECLLDYSVVSNNTECVSREGFDCPIKSMCTYYLQKVNFFRSKSILTNYHWYIFNYFKNDFKAFAGTVVFDEVHAMFDVIIDVFLTAMNAFRVVAKEHYNNYIYMRYTSLEYDAADNPFRIAVESEDYEEVNKLVKFYIESMHANTNHNPDHIQKLRDMTADIALLIIAKSYGINVRSFTKINLVKRVFSVLSRLKDDNKIKIFMSATISKEFYFDNFHDEDVDKELVYYDSMDPYFKRENRLIYTFKNLPNVNFTNLKSKEFTDTLNTIALNIMNIHAKQKGFIYCNSYDQVKIVKDFINSLGDKALKNRIIFNDSPKNSNSTLDAFKSDKTDKVLVACNIQEGVSFDDDMSRFQIILKVPFLHHSQIKDYSEQYYYERAVITLLQIYGRSIRNPKDYASTYILDNSYKLLNKYLPQWFKDSIIER